MIYSSRVLVLGLFCTLVFASLSAWAELDVRVRRNAVGVPQLQVNGRPVAPRMFYGDEGYDPLVADTEWTDFAYEFRAYDDERGTVHFRFAAEGPKKVEFRNLRLAEVESGQELETEWKVFPHKYADNVQKTGDVVSVEIPERQPREDFHFYSSRRLMRRGVRYRVSGSVRAESRKVVRLGAYLVDSNGKHEPVKLSGNDPFPRQIALAASAGVNFVTFEVPKSIWTDDETYDFSEAERLSNRILAANPKAMIIPRIKIETCGWWAFKHPDHQIVYDDGSKPGIPCISSRLYREKAVKFLAAFTRHMCTKYPDNFAGIHPAGQTSCEWFYWNGWGRPLNGYDPATLAAWRKWRAEHGDPNADTAVVPSAAARRDTSRGILRDPSVDGEVIAFSQFQQEEMVDFMAEVAKACRQASDGKKLVLFFYGYPWEFSVHAYGLAVTGHLGLQRLLDKASADIDVLCSPISYSDRSWDGCGLSMAATDTVMRSGVLWLMEDDTRTYLEPDKAAAARFGCCQNLQETQEVLRRNTAQEILRGLGCWWMDLHATGWFDSPELWTEMAALSRLDQLFLDRKAPLNPDVAAIVDERSLLAVANGGATGRCMGAARKSFARAGAPFGQYLMSDVMRNGLSARLQVFQAAYCGDDDLVTAVAAQRAAHPEVTRVWCWAPGYLTRDGKRVEGVQALTGFKVRKAALTDPKAQATAAGRAVCLPDSWGEKGKIDPLLAVETEPGDEVWATYADGSPAIVLRGKEVFVGTPDWCTELVRALEKRAGVHSYLKSGEAAVWAAEGWLTFHALKDGELVLDTGSASDVTDYYTGQLICTGPEVKLQVKCGETRVLKIK